MASDELVLLERVFLRLGSAESDEQLQNVLSKFLPPVLLKLASPEEKVRKKVMELLIHINKRIKSRAQVQLPVEALLTQYQDPAATSFVTNFTIIYLKSGFPRLPLEKQAELVPTVLNALENKPQTHLDTLLLLIVPLLGKVQVPTDPEKVSCLFGFKEKPQISKHFLDLLLDILLLPYGALAPVQNQDQQENATYSSLLPVPAGMSDLSFKRITTNNTMKPETLEEIKLGIVKFLSHGVFPVERIIVHLIIAAADTRFSVANLADTELKRVVGIVDWTSSSISMNLFNIFLGSQVKNLKPEEKKSPACTRIRLKLLIYLCKVTGKGLIFPASIQVIFDSLYGTNTNVKLKTLALNFTQNVIRYADQQSLEKFAPVLLSGMKKLIDMGEEVHQGQAYVLIGNLAQSFPKIIYQDVTVLEIFFKNLESSNPDLKLQIREGILNLIPAYKYDIYPELADKDGRLNILYALTKFRVSSEEWIVRFVAVRTLATIFPPAHVPSKFLILTCVGDSKDEVSAEAVKALYGSSRVERDLAKRNTFVTPPFAEVVSYIFNESETLVKDSSKHFTIGNHVLPFTLRSYLEILTYLRICCLRNVDIPLTRDMLSHPCEYSPIIVKHLKGLFDDYKEKDNNPLILYARLIHQLLMANPSIEPLTYMIELIGSVPQVFTFDSKGLQWIRDQLNSSKEEVREHAAILYGLLLKNSSAEEFEKAVKDLVNNAENQKSIELQCGAILGMGHVLEMKIMVDREAALLRHGDLIKTCINLLVKVVKQQNPLTVGNACHSIGLLGRTCKLSIDDGEDKNGSPDAKRLASNNVTKIDIVNSLADVMTNSKLSTKIRERAAKALGLLCVGEKFPHTRLIIQTLLNSNKETKDVEVHFTIGEALVMCCQSIWSPEARNLWDTLPNDYIPNTQEPLPNDNIEWILDELLKLAKQPHPNSKQASCIWLLAILKACGEIDPITDRLQTIQNAFMSFLCENNDIIQDVASKALCVIYDTYKSTDLLTALVKQLTSGTRQTMQVTDDTKLFEEGQLGQAPTGGNLTTYKELCSLASDLNKPDLIYQFLHLSKHNAIWNSKKGAAFGFSSIAKQCGEDLKEHMPLIIPKLYRYQFDPNPNIQLSMHNIWKVLVSDSQKMLDEYYDKILADLLENLNSNQYRVRQSCCLALQDFLKGSGNRTIYDCINSMDELWSKLFRVMDDHHEVTRGFAVRTATILSKLCTRACSAEQGKSGTQMVEALLPPFLKTGIISSVIEIRIISLQTISELVVSAGKQLKPFLPTLIPALLNSQTPATDTVSKSLQFADSSILEELVPKIIELLKSSVSVGTRVAVANFVTLLSVQMGQDLQPFTAKLLLVFVNGLMDRNPIIRKQYASTIGHIVSSAKDSSLEKLFAKLQQWYFEREDDSVRSACAYTIQSIGIHNQEIIKSYSNIVLPLVFFAMHSEKSPETEQTLQIWNEIWSEHSPGTETGIRQNLENIVSVLKTALESPSWTMKAQAANAVATVASKLGATMEAAHRNSLIDVLLNGLSGRIWTGKDKLLAALASICVNCKDTIKDDKDVDITKIIDSALKECRKEDLTYKASSLKSLGDILSSLTIDRFDEVYVIIEGILQDNKKDNENESSEESAKKNEAILKLKEAAYETLGKTWPENAKSTQQKYQEMFVHHCVECLPTITRSVQASVIIALYNFVDKLILLNVDHLSPDETNILGNIINKIVTALRYALGISKHIKLRKEALNIVTCLGSKLKNNPSEFHKLKLMFDEMLPVIEVDKQPEIQSRLSAIRSLLLDVN